MGAGGREWWVDGARVWCRSFHHTSDHTPSTLPSHTHPLSHPSHCQACYARRLYTHTHTRTHTLSHPSHCQACYARRRDKMARAGSTGDDFIGNAVQVPHYAPRTTHTTHHTHHSPHIPRVHHTAHRALRTAHRAPRTAHHAHRTPHTTPHRSTIQPSTHHAV